MNKVILIGRMVKDPEIRATTSGTSVCSFTIACDKKYVKQGEERKADFINCVAWGNSADAIGKFLSKGKKIALNGRIETRSWTNNEGKTNYATEVIAEEWEFVESKGESQQTTPTTYESATEDNFEGDIDGFMPVDEDDLPF
jgi:single-strand DNA-binding protein